MQSSEPDQNDIRHSYDVREEGRQLIWLIYTIASSMSEQRFWCKDQGWLAITLYRFIISLQSSGK